jgi:hypothetical protein
VPGNIELHVHIDQLADIDHACFELLYNWRKQHEAQGGRMVLDWDRLATASRPTSLEKRDATA